MLLECTKQPGPVYHVVSWSQNGCASLEPQDTPSIGPGPRRLSAALEPRPCKGLADSGPPTPVSVPCGPAADPGPRKTPPWVPGLLSAMVGRRLQQEDTERQLWTPRRGPFGSQPATRQETRGPRPKVMCREQAIIKPQSRWSSC